MKIQETKTDFIPKTVQFTFETQDELDALGSLFNISSIVDSTKGKIPCRDIYNVLQQSGADISRYAVLFGQEISKRGIPF